MQELLQGIDHGRSQRLVSVLLAHIGYIEEHAAGGLEFLPAQASPLQEEAAGFKELISHAGGQFAGFPGFSEIVVVLNDLGHHVVVAAEAHGNALQREVLLREDLLAHIQHFQGLLRLTGIDERVGNGQEQLTLGKHAQEGVHILIVHKIVLPLQGIPLVDRLHLLIQADGIHPAGIRRAHLVADGRKAVGEAVIHEVILDAHVEVSAHVEQIERTVPLIVGQQVQHEELRLGNVVLVLGDGERDAVGDLGGKFLRDNPVFDAILPVYGNYQVAGADEIQLEPVFEGHLHLGVAEHVHDV